MPNVENLLAKGQQLADSFAFEFEERVTQARKRAEQTRSAQARSYYNILKPRLNHFNSCDAEGVDDLSLLETRGNGVIYDSDRLPPDTFGRYPGEDEDGISIE